MLTEERVVYRYSLSSARSLFYRQELVLTPEGVRPEGRVTAERVENPGAGGERPSRRKWHECPSCGVDIVRWLGVRWYGTPWPVRMWIRYVRGERHVWKGCGCIVRLRNMAIAARWSAVALWRACRS